MPKVCAQLARNFCLLFVQLGEKLHLSVSGLIYTITDVKDLHDWMVKHLSEHPLFERLTDEELKADPVVEMLYESTEEGQKVTRNEGEKWPAVFRRLPNPVL